MAIYVKVLRRSPCTPALGSNARAARIVPGLLQLSLVLLFACLLAGCGTFSIQGSLKSPAEVAATAQARSASATVTPQPRLGQVAFIQGGDLWVQELPEGLPRRLTQDGRNSTPLWSPSGEWIAFRKEHGVWVTRSSGTATRVVDTSGVRQFAWSPEADRLAYIAQGALFTENADGTDRRELVPTTRGAEGSGVTAMAWSPDGGWIAFEKLEQMPQKLPNVQGLWRTKVDGSEIKEVYLNPDPFQAQSHLAGWSPDGQFLLFWQGERMSASLLADGVPLIRVPVVGGTPAQITIAMLAYRDFLAWSPDGQQLALADGGFRGTWDNKAIAVAPLTGGLQRLSESGRADLFPAWSQDGRWIAFASGQAAPGVGGDYEAWRAIAQRRIWLMQSDGSARRPLTNDENFRDERPRWSADGTFILFVRLSGAQAQLWLMRADGSEQRPVVSGMTPSPGWFGSYGYIDWSQLYDWWTGGHATRSL
ncbi:MAG: hypothetical protein AB1566_13635 [Chloroflexota bacterium]